MDSGVGSDKESECSDVCEDESENENGGYKNGEKKI
jgi:hypothetical protein